MSVWNEIDLTAISTEPIVLPENQEFTFELLPGARYSKYDPNRVEASAKVAGGEFANQVKYFSYPDPAKYDWSAGVFVRMTHALGEEIAEGEDPVDYLNRNAGKQFVSRVKHRTFSSDGVDGTKDEVAIGNVKPVR